MPIVPSLKRKWVLLFRKRVNPFYAFFFYSLTLFILGHIFSPFRHFFPHKNDAEVENKSFDKDVQPDMFY